MGKEGTGGHSRGGVGWDEEQYSLGIGTVCLSHPGL